MTAAPSLSEIREKVLARASQVEAAAAGGQEPGTHLLFRTTPEASSGLRFRAKPPPLPMVFRGFGFLGIAVLLSAAGGVGKSWLALIIAASLATGKPLLGETLAPVMTGNTVLFFPEDPTGAKHQRIYDLASALGIDGDTFLKSIFTPEMYGEDTCLMVKTPKGFQTTEAFTALIDFVKRCPNVVCIILDPLNLLHGTDLEVDPAAAQYLANRMAFLAKETNTLVIVAHHSTKGETDPQKFKLEAVLHANTARGSGAIINGFRGVLTLAALSGDFAKKELGLAVNPAPGEYVAAKIAKNNYGPVSAPFFFCRDMNTGLLTPFHRGPKQEPIAQIKKMRTLNRLLPLIVQEVAEQEGQEKRFTKATFANIYNKTWKSAGDVDASKSTLTAAIELALVEGYLCTKILPSENGKDATYLTTVGAFPLPEKQGPENGDAWLDFNNYPAGEK